MTFGASAGCLPYFIWAILRGEPVISITYLECIVFFQVAAFAPSRILREHIAALFCCRPRDSLEHTFHWTFWEPPFRKRCAAALSAASGELTVPSCFLPREDSRAPPAACRSKSAGLKRVSPGGVEESLSA